MNIEVDLTQIANGAVQEAFAKALEKVIENILDPNTEAEKVRKITLDMSFKPNELRSTANISFVAKTKLQPYKPITTTLVTGYRNGEIGASELLSGAVGQTFVDVETGEVLEDNGNPIKDNKVTDINKNKQFK